ncbi:MAG: RagB/SusD family nutrient uptake outer membrane protein [Bacteroidales bacterium]|jgi:hypothetical protein|nr:RagB/SusD family nutrient uptake outer membrane protein [Bacteroidales bacterium]
MIKIIIPFLVCLPLLLGSCKDYLNIDNYFSEELKLDSIFKEHRYVEAYMWTIPIHFNDEAVIWQNNDTPGPLATDEAFCNFNIGGNQINGMSFVLGETSASYMNALNKWSRMYMAIRKCNTIFNRINEVADMTAEQRRRILANTRFIRAYAYYQILVDMGPPILLGEDVVANNEDLAFYDRGRCTYDEAVEYICSELEDAASGLELKTSLMNFGRPTKGAAYGLVARLRLIHASPLYNGGPAARSVFGRWKRSTDDVQYVSQVPEERRWAVAAAAARRVMDMGLYKLHTAPVTAFSKPLPESITSDPDYYKPWPDGATEIDHFKSYSDMFTGESVIPTNPEFVWGRNSGTVAANTQMAFPLTNAGWGSLAVPQKIIDAYRMFDGRTIYDSPRSDGLYPYSETGFSQAPELFSDYQLLGGTYNMYINREMRFYASIGFTNCWWEFGSVTNTTAGVKQISYLVNGNNGKNSATSDAQINHTATGYVLKKFVHPTDSWFGDNNRRLAKGWPIIRYAEILLSYAEALNNLTTSHTVEVDGVEQTFTRDMEEIRLAFGQVRHRAGLPAPSNTELSNPQTIQSLIEQERMVEFLCENRRYYDVRRWGKYEESESTTMTGMNIEGDENSYYRRVIPNNSRIGQRVVNKRLHLVPLPLDEVRRLPSLDQNPGWQN